MHRLVGLLAAVLQKTQSLLQQPMARYMDQMHADIAKIVAAGNPSE